MQLKSQDTVLAVKYWSSTKANKSYSVREIAESTGISASEVSKGCKRLTAAHLVVSRDGQVFAEIGALFEWLAFGVRYAYPQESVGYGRGIPTSWNCPVLKSEMALPTPAWVWPVAGGDSDGTLIKPIHDSVPFASSQDEGLYRVLSLLEAIRGGKPRELVIARKLLTDIIKGK